MSILDLDKVLRRQRILGCGAISHHDQNRVILFFCDLQHTEGALRRQIFGQPFDMFLCVVMVLRDPGIYGKLHHIIAVTDQEPAKNRVGASILFRRDRQIK